MEEGESSFNLLPNEVGARLEPFWLRLGRAFCCKGTNDRISVCRRTNPSSIRDGRIDCIGALRISSERKRIGVSRLQRGFEVDINLYLVLILLLHGHDDDADAVVGVF